MSEIDNAPELATPIHCASLNLAMPKTLQTLKLAELSAVAVTRFRIDSFDPLRAALREAASVSRPVELMIKEFRPLRVIYQTSGVDAGIAWCFERRQLLQIHLLLASHSNAERSAIAELQEYFGEPEAMAGATWLPVARPAWITINVHPGDRRCVRSGLAGFFLSAAFCDEFG